MQAVNQAADSEKLLHNIMPVYERLGLHDLGVKCYQEALEIVKTFGDRPSQEAILNYCDQEDDTELDDEDWLS